MHSLCCAQCIPDCTYFAQFAPAKLTAPISALSYSFRHFEPLRRNGKGPRPFPLQQLGTAVIS